MGGAGAFSDGKLTLSTEIGGSLEQFTGVNGLNELINYIDQTYVKFGAPERIFGLEHEEEIQEVQRRAVLSELKLIPVRIRHMGTGRCQEVLQRMKEHLVEHGVEVMTSCPVEEVLLKDNTVRGVITRDGKIINAKHVVLAPGREGSEWLSREAAPGA